MKAGLRVMVAALAAGMFLGQGAAVAQSAEQPAAKPPATETVGPRELQNFNLNGTVTRPADAPAAAAESPPPTHRTAAPSRSSSPASSESPRREASSTARPNTAQPVAEVRTPPARTPANPAQSQTVSLAAATQASASLPTTLAEPGFSTDSASAPAALAPERSLSLWPWLLLAVVIGGGAVLLLRRRQSRLSYAGGAEVDAFVAPEPEIQPQPQVQPRPAPSSPPPAAAKPKPVGLVSAKLRPWLEIEFTPLQCVVDVDKVSFDFEVNLFNSGGAPARDVLVEARIFNAGPNQEQELKAFYAQPPGPGERSPMLPPLQRLAIRTSLFADREHLQVVDVGGRKSLVPLIAFNATYRAAGTTGRTSGCFMLGRKTKADKLAPFRAEDGARAYASVGAVALPEAVRS